MMKNNAAMLLTAIAVCVAGTVGASGLFKNGAPEWLDADGQSINCHCGGIFVENGVYWWYGEHRDATRRGHQCHTGIRCYSSSDLKTWKSHGVVLAVTDERDSPIGDGCMMERPKVLRSRSTGKYVMYFHQELPGQYYSAARTGIAVADRPEGPFRYVKGGRPDPFKTGECVMARDQTLFRDDDGKTYHVFSTDDNATLMIAELTDDLLDYTGRAFRILPTEYNEAPALMKHDDWYYLLTSGTTGWAPNPARVHRARRLEGPWESVGNPCRGMNPLNGMSGARTWGGQSSHIFRVATTDAPVALFDILHEPSPDKSRYIMVPVGFDDDGRMILDWSDEATFATAFTPQAFAKSQREAEIAAVRAMAELEMYPPEINLDPKPEDYAPRVWRYGLNGGVVQMKLKSGVKYPDDWGFAMNAGVSITRKGRLWATWFLGEDGPEAFVAGARSDDGGKTWSYPKFVLDPHFKDDRILKIFPVMRGCVVAETWVDPDGALHLFASISVGTPMVRGVVWDYVCRDPDADRLVFEKPVFVGYGWMHNKPLVLRDGTWVMATELEGGVSDDCFPELIPVRGVSSVRSTDKGRTWMRSNAVKLRETGHVIEPSIVEKADGTLWMLARTGIGIHEAFSTDGGKSWGPLRKAKWIDNPISRFAFLKLRSGSILLVKNGDAVNSCDGVNARNKLKAYISKDMGATWSKGYGLDMRGWVDYPDAEEGRDGRIAITWGVDRRGLAEIRCAYLTEAEIVRGNTIGKDKFVGHRVFKALPLKEWEAKRKETSEFCIWEDTSKD